MSLYHATADRDGRYWRIHVDEVDRVTQARHLRDIDAMGRDLVAVMTGEDPDTIELDVTLRLPANAQAHVTRAQELRQQASQANAEAAQESRAAVHELTAAGLSLRDIGRLLGVSYQRAHQLAQEAQHTDAARAS